MAVVAKWQEQLFMQLSQNNNFIFIFVPITTTTTTNSEWLGIFPIAHHTAKSNAEIIVVCVQMKLKRMSIVCEHKREQTMNGEKDHIIANDN